ncbi:MAG: hypothetical protein ABI859_15795, partial [Pseudomonadota bacterium]
MNFIRQLGFTRLGNGATARLEEDGRVLHLFRNRAELKKAYGDLQDEIHRLKDRVKQQEGATSRVQEMLEALEARLSAPPSGLTTLVFYQLRDLWSAGRELIGQMITDLAQQQEERERRQFLAEFNRQQFERRQEVEQRLNEAQLAAADVRSKLAELQVARARASSWWLYFKRRELDRRIHVMNAEMGGATESLDAANAAFAAVAAEVAPEFPGISIDARRAINIAGIAYAEVLCLRLAKTPLVTLARDATHRREPQDEYGDQATCLALMADIARAKVNIQNRNSVVAEVRQRSERLKVAAKYRSPADAVPTEEALMAAK